MKSNDHLSGIERTYRMNTSIQVTTIATRIINAAIATKRFSRCRTGQSKYLTGLGELANVLKLKPSFCYKARVVEEPTTKLLAQRGSHRPDDAHSHNRERQNELAAAMQTHQPTHSAVPSEFPAPFLAKYSIPS